MKAKMGLYNSYLGEGNFDLETLIGGLGSRWETKQYAINFTRVVTELTYTWMQFCISNGNITRNPKISGRLSARLAPVSITGTSSRKA